MSDLRDRLRMLRHGDAAPVSVPPSQPQPQPQQPSAPRQHALGPPPHTNAGSHAHVDEVGALMQQMGEQLRLERGQGTLQLHSGDEDDEEEGETPSYLLDTGLLPTSRGDERAIPLQGHTQAHLTEESARLQRDVTAGLADWRHLQPRSPAAAAAAAGGGQSPSAALAQGTTAAQGAAVSSASQHPPSVRLIRESRDRPVLQRGGSATLTPAPAAASAEHADDADGLASELAAAMGEVLASPSGSTRDACSATATQHTPEEQEADDLVARLTRLRGASPSPSQSMQGADAGADSLRAAAAGSDALFSLPSAPTSAPQASLADSSSKKKEQQLPTDLRAFSKLVRLSAANAEPDSLQARLDALKAREKNAATSSTSVAAGKTSGKPSSSSAKADLLQHFGLPSAPTGLGPAHRTAAEEDDEDGERSEEDETDTWCVLCNADATLRCTGCDGDLYCSSCWVEAHNMSRDELREHKTAEYTPRRLRLRQQQQQQQGRRRGRPPPPPVPRGDDEDNGPGAPPTAFAM